MFMGSDGYGDGASAAALYLSNSRGRCCVYLMSTAPYFHVHNKFNEATHIGGISLEGSAS